MKPIFALVLSLALAGSMDAAPKEKNEGRRGAKVAAGASGVATQRGVTMRAQSQPSFSGDRSRMSVAATRSDSLTQSRSVTPTQTRVYSQPTSTYTRPSSTSQRVVTSDWNRDRDADRDRDRDWDRNRDRDGSRDWSDRRHRLSHDVYRNWDRNRVYSWNNNRYRWYGGTWVIYGSTPTVVYSDSLPVVGSSIIAAVQDELSDRGYNAGPADGVIGGRTRRAIADFQDDRGLAVTGTINRSLLRALNID